jgi:hypothetical protein
VTGKYAPVGISNFAGSPVGATLDIGFLHWEPGPAFSQLMDLDWLLNYERSLRMFQKTLPYATAPTAANAKSCPGWMNGVCYNNQFCYPLLQFVKRMAKAPTIGIFSFDNATAGSVSTRSTANATTGDWAGAFASISEVGAGYFSGGAAPPANAATMLYHYTADTGL